MGSFFCISGDCFHLAAILALLGGLLKTRNARTLSLRSQELYLMVYLMRYLGLEMAGPVGVHNSVFKVLYILFILFTMTTLITTRFYTGDTWPGEIETKLWYWAAFGIVVGSYLVGMWSQYHMLEMLWVVSQALELFGIFPQGWLIYKKQNGQHYVVLWVALMFSYRLSYCFDWLYSTMTENKMANVSFFSSGTQVSIFLCLFLYAIMVNKRKIRLNLEDRDIEFMEVGAAREEYTFLRSSDIPGADSPARQHCFRKAKK